MKFVRIALAASSLATVVACGSASQNGSEAKDSAFNNVPATAYSCTEASQGADHGYTVRITTGGIAGLMAHVGELWIGGTHDRGVFQVRQEDGGLQRKYVGEGFSLDIALESFAPTTQHPATMKVTVDGQELSKEMICRDQAAAQPRPTRPVVRPELLSLRCSEPNLVDAGYSLQVFARGGAFSRVKLGKVTIAGTEIVADYTNSQALTTSTPDLQEPELRFFNPSLMDAGYSIYLTDGNLAGQRAAIIKKITIAGEQELATLSCAAAN